LFVLSLAVLALALVPAAGLAAKGGGGNSTGGGGKPGGGGGGKPSGGTGSFTHALADSNANGVPNWGESLTFSVTSSVSQPWVNLTCYQGGDWVTNQNVGYYAGYPWSQVFPLSSWKWTSGGANCTARLYDGLTNATLASTSFTVDP
jgi:hypothetical protein